MSVQRTPALVPTLFVALGLAACGAEQREESESVPEGTIQLSDRLDGARIESPLVDVEGAQDLTSLADPLLDVLLDETFEDFDWTYEDWPRVPGAGIEQEGEGHVLKLEQPTQASMGWVLPARTDAFYHFERSVRVLGEPFCDLYVVETGRDFEEAGINSQAQFLAGRGEALKIHSLPIESGEEVEGVWQRGSTSFYPTPRTRSLVVLVRLRVGADPGAVVRAMSFDDVRLEQVLPSPRERVRLLKSAHLAPEADPALGMRKAGWLLPLPSPQRARKGEPAESNYNWRRALYAPPTTELAFDLLIPEGARLRLATGLASETPPGALARFQVELSHTDQEGPELLLDRAQAARMEDWRWEELDVDLSAWAGSQSTLVLRTQAEEGDPHPLWANPRIEVAAEQSDPLVILIAVDTLRADRLSSYGYERATSPALDQLAADGVRFDQARSNCNWTCPSFASIFTGLVPSRHGVSSYGPATPLPDELVTLAEHFQSRGWETRSIAYKVPLFDGNYEQGFDQAFNVPRDMIRGEENLARALEWLETHRGGPSFLFLHFNDPHQPFIHPEPLDRAFDAETRPRGFPIPGAIPGGDQEEAQRKFADLYDGAVAYVDSCIGRFLDSLRERGLYERASIAFVADHGEQLWEHGRFGHGGDDLYDEIVRVPLIVKPPIGYCPPGQVLEANVSAFDVMPTLLELADIPAAGELDARSLVPLMLGTQEEFERAVVTETSQRGLALVDGGYKFVLAPGGRAEALFHLESDPQELKDLAQERPEVMERLRALVIAYILEHRPGHYLLAHGGEESTRLHVSTRAVRTLVGSAPVTAAGETPGSSVSLPAGAWALLELEDPQAADVLVQGLETRGQERGFEPWVAGKLASLKEVGVWRVSGPEPTGRSDRSLRPIDLEQLEALKRLGYAE